MTEQEMNEIVTKVSEANELNEKRSAELAQREADLQKREAALANDNPANIARSEEMDTTMVRSINDAMLEKRAITLNGAGAVSYVSELFKAAMQKSKVAGRVRTIYGPNSSTVIPVLAPRPAVPSAVAEGATSLTADSSAALGAKTIQPKAFYCELPVSYEALKWGAANLEAELPQIFRDAFVSALDTAIVSGSTAPIVGLYSSVPTANKIACAASGLPKLADMVSLAEKLNDFDITDPVIIISPTAHAALLAETDSVYDFVKEELARNNSILGCEVIVTGKAPSTTTAGSTIAVGCSLSNFCVGIASDLTIEPIRKPGDTNTYFQAIMGMGGTVVVDSAVYGLKTV